jgi:hypothetical protein
VQSIGRLSVRVLKKSAAQNPDLAIISPEIVNDQLLLLAEPLIGVRVLADSGVIHSNNLIALADLEPAISVEGLDLLSHKVEFAACHGLDPELEMLGRKIEVSTERPNTRGVIPVPGEDAALVVTELGA